MLENVYKLVICFLSAGWTMLNLLECQATLTNEIFTLYALKWFSDDALAFNARIK